MFKWLWDRLEKHMPLEEDGAAFASHIPHYRDDELAGIVEAALAEIVGYGEDVVFEIYMLEPEGSHVYAARFRHEGLVSSADQDMYDPIDGQTPLRATGSTPEEALANFRRVLAPYFPPPRAGETK